MAHIPKAVAESSLSQALQSAGLVRVHQGKVRDTYVLSNHPDKLLVVATDRLSIFDFVLPTLIPGKGEILTAMTVFWLIQVLSDFSNHLVAYGRGVDLFLPGSIVGNSELQKRALVVRKLEMLPLECIVRGHLTGSGWKAYQNTGSVCGHPLSEGLHDGSLLPKPIFTPTTKADMGHDERYRSGLRAWGQENLTA